MKMTGILGRLHEEHEQIAGLFDIIEVTSGPEDRLGLLDTLRKEILVHVRAEEAVLYEEFQAEESMQELAENAMAEHDEIEDVLEELVAIDPEDEDWIGVLREVRGMMADHVTGEESETFLRAWETLGEEGLEELEDVYGAARDRAESQLLEGEGEAEEEGAEPSHP